MASGRRVLIVEEEPYLAEAVRDGLPLEAIAADGDSAWELFSVISYDLAVLDRDIRALRRRGRHRAVSGPRSQSSIAW
jgi:DNA-binding response OmpR family regulator